jgi:hypothetical protein
MHRSWVIGFAVLALVGSAISQDQPPTTTTLAGTGAVPETTEVLGAVPDDLTGRWLAVGNMKLPDGKTRSIPRAFEIREGSEHLEVVLGRLILPARINTEIETAAAAGQAWTPDAEDLREVKESWGKTPPAGGIEYAKIENKIIDDEAFAPEFKEDEVSKGSNFVITFHEFYSGRQPVRKMYSVYGVRSRAQDKLAGTFLTSSMAMAPFPIPITLKGDFEAYRVDSGSTRSWFERLFSGCGR